MSVRIIVNRSRKLSKDYNSEAYGVTLDTEYAGDVTTDPRGFTDKVQQLFDLVEEQLDVKLKSANGESSSSRNGSNGCTTRSSASPSRRSSPSNGNGRDNTRRRLTQAQEKAIWSIARRIEQDADEWADKELNVDGVTNLTVAQASKLIDLLKAEVDAQTTEAGTR